jgi:hypothetical protein
MHLRRALLLMALVVFVVAAVGALVPAPGERSAGRPPALAPGPVAGAALRTLELRYPAREEARRLRIATGAHVVVEVSTTQPGEASIAGLGLVQPAEPSTPARFDLLAEQAGTFEVSFHPAVGDPGVVGRLVVASPG